MIAGWPWFALCKDKTGQQRDLKAQRFASAHDDLFIHAEGAPLACMWS
jgi:hypothetical protein